MTRIPKARNENVVVQNLNAEVLIYDLTNNKAYCLNETSALVYKACDGKTSFDELKRRHKFTDDLIYLALDELRRENLIEGDGDNHFAGLTRREAIRRAGLSTLVALPVISSLVAPTAAHAQSAARLANGQICNTNNQCSSNICNSSRRCCSANNFQACARSVDCCSGVACTNNVCCQGAGRVCDTRNNTCCAGLTCVPDNGVSGNGSCQ